MTDFARLVLLAVLVSGLASLPVHGHGASRGLHIHVTPDPAREGASLLIELNASRPLASARVAVDGRAPRHYPIDPPDRRLAVRIELPRRVSADAVNVRAEARTPGGKDLRASAIVRIERDNAPDPPEGKTKDASGPTDSDQGEAVRRSNASAAPLPSAATTHGSVGLTPKP